MTDPTPEELLKWVNLDFTEEILKGDYGATTKAASFLHQAVNYSADHVGMEPRTQVFLKHIIELGVKPYLEAFKQGYMAANKLNEKRFEASQLGHLKALLDALGPDRAEMVVSNIEKYAEGLLEREKEENKDDSSLGD